MAAISSASPRFRHYPPPPIPRGYPIELLIKLGWISPEFVQSAALYRKAFESRPLKACIDTKKMSDPIDSLNQLKGNIYAEWTRQYLQDGELPKDPAFFIDDYWARTVCPIVVSRLFSECVEPGLNRETYLKYEPTDQIDIVLRLDQLCHAIAKDYGEPAVDLFLVALGKNENADWALQVLNYAIFGQVAPEAILKVLCEVEVIKKGQH